jgi:hypothetical protein
MPFFRWLGLRLLALALAVFGGLWAGILHALGRLARWVGIGIAYLAALAAAGYGVVWFITTHPQTFEQLLLLVIGLGLAVWGLWMVISSPFRSSQGGRGRRRRR